MTEEIDRAMAPGRKTGAPPLRTGIHVLTLHEGKSAMLACGIVQSDLVSHSFDDDFDDDFNNDSMTISMTIR